MANLSGATPTPVSDVMLARYVAGDLRGDQLARVERAIGETPGLADRLERMKLERAAFLQTAPPQQFAHQVVTRLTVERPAVKSKWGVWWLMPPVTVAAALLFGVVYQHALGPQSLAPAAVTTDDAFDLPGGVATKAEPTLAPELEEKPIELSKATANEFKSDAAAGDPAAERKAELRGDFEGARAGKRPPARDLEKADKNAKKAPAGADDDLANDDKARLADMPRDGIASKDASASGAAQSIGAGGQGAGALGRATTETGKGYAQPPSSSTPATPAPSKPQPVAPPAWAAPPPPARAPPAEQPARRESPADSERQAQRAPTAAPVNKAPAPEPRPTVNAGPASSAMAEAEAAPAKSKAEDKRSRAQGDESANEDSGEKVVSTSVSITREQGGRTRAVTASDQVPAGGLVKVTAQGSTYITVVGVRRDGVPYVYGQATSSDGQPVTIAIRMRPSSSRVTEALFVVMSDAPLSVQREMVTGSKDASQLPQRLSVPGAQRRFVLNVSSVAED